MTKDCLFCKIAKKQIKAEIVYEDSQVMAFKDIHPIAPVHILIIPVRHINSVADAAENDTELLGKIVMTAKKIAEDFKIATNGYKLLFRVRKYGGQEIPHIHLHLLGGARLAENIYPIGR